MWRIVLVLVIFAIISDLKARAMDHGEGTVPIKPRIIIDRSTGTVTTIMANGTKIVKHYNRPAAQQQLTSTSTSQVISEHQTPRFPILIINRPPPTTGDLQPPISSQPLVPQNTRPKLIIHLVRKSKADEDLTADKDTTNPVLSSSTNSSPLKSPTISPDTQSLLFPPILLRHGVTHANDFTNRASHRRTSSAVHFKFPEAIEEETEEEANSGRRHHRSSSLFLQSNAPLTVPLSRDLDDEKGDPQGSQSALSNDVSPTNKAQPSLLRQSSLNRPQTSSRLVKLSKRLYILDQIRLLTPDKKQFKIIHDAVICAIITLERYPLVFTTSPLHSFKILAKRALSHVLPGKPLNAEALQDMQTVIQQFNKPFGIYLFNNNAGELDIALRKKRATDMQTLSGLAAKYAERSGSGVNTPKRTVSPDPLLYAKSGTGDSTLSTAALQLQTQSDSQDSQESEGKQDQE